MAVPAASSSKICFMQQRVSPDTESSYRPRPALEMQGLGCPASPCVSTLDGWQSLPDHIMEHILQSSEMDAKTKFALCGVCSGWRRVAKRLFFSDPWLQHTEICHPSQLFTQSPRSVEGGLLRCFVVRQTTPAAHGPSLKPRYNHFAMYQGADHTAPGARFLLGAQQHGKTSFSITLSHSSSITPAGAAAAAAATCAHLSGNLTRMQYKLVSSPAPWVRRIMTSSGHMLGQGGRAGLLVARYCMHMRGLMLPRRVIVELPHPQELTDNPLFAGALPSPLSSPGRPENDVPYMVDEAGYGGMGHQAGAHAGMGPHGHGPWQGAPLWQPQGGTSELDVQRLLTPPTMTPAVTPLSRQRHMPVVDEEEGGDSGQGQAQGLKRMLKRAWRAMSLRRSQSESAEHFGPSLGASGRKGIGRSKSWGAGGDRKGSGNKRGAAAATGRVVRLVNKAPHWNDQLKCWCLNFHSRVRLPSIKNYQLTIGCDNRNRVVMQFGKVEADVFVLDFNPTVMTALQAFALALSSFERKYAM